MALTRLETDTANISKLSDRPNQNDGLSSAQLKGRFDKAGDDIKTYINDVLLEELERTTDGDSGADNIGATAVGDGTATTVQGILEEIDADVTALDSAVVHKTGSETITGTKLFTQSPMFATGFNFGTQDDYIEPRQDGSLEIAKSKVNREVVLTLTPAFAEEEHDMLKVRSKYGSNYKVWHEGNDGHGSGLDADTLDGKQDADMVHKAGTETITGVKTFSVSPVVPTPTADANPATKKYVDDTVNGHVTNTNNPHEVTAAQVGALSTTDAGDLAELTTTEKGSLVGAINELNTDKVETSAIVNTLTETEEGKVLDARQGKVLADLVSTKESITNVAAYLKNISPVYGILWDKGENPTLTRTDASVNMVANIGIGAQVVRNDFDSAPIYRDMVEVEDTLGNKFIRIPKLYIKKTDSTNYKQWQVSLYKHDGFYLPWCFWDFINSKELPYVDVGRYDASLNGTKLASVANTYPLINKNIVEFRTYATNNNAGGLLGYQLLDVHVIDVLRTLFFIEFATLDSQAIMKGYTAGQYTATHLATVTETGTNRIVVANAHADLYRVGQAISVGTTQGGNQIFYGRTITAIDYYDVDNKAIWFDGDPVNITTGNFLYNTGWKSGFSSNIVASSGCIVANDGKYPCSYRGIENPFGSVWQFVDGVNITDNQAWVCKDAGQYASNVFASPYEKLSYVNLNANGFGPVEMGYDSNLPFAEFATNVTGGSTSKYYCDYYYQASGSRIARFGGSWGSGSNAGLSGWTLSGNSSHAVIDVGGRLVRKAL